MSKMSTLMIPLLKEILIKEIGEANITPLSWKQVGVGRYKFLVDINEYTEVVTVDLQKLDEIEKRYYLPPAYRNAENVYNVAYEISGIATQFAKTNIKTLLQIISTVVDIVKEFIGKTSPDVLLIAASEKIAGNVELKQKLNLYHAIVKKGINSIPGYTSDVYKNKDLIIKNN